MAKASGRSKQITGLLCALVVLGACEHRTAPIPLELRGPPFHQMRYVELGMAVAELGRYHELQQVNATQYREQLGEFSVVYDFDDDGLAAITVPETDQPGEDGMRRYDTYLRNSNRAFDDPATCRFNERTASMMALYELPRAWFEIHYTPVDGGAHTVVTRSYRLAPSPEWQEGRPQVCMR